LQVARDNPNMTPKKIAKLIDKKYSISLDIRIGEREKLLESKSLEI